MTYKLPPLSPKDLNDETRAPTFTFNGRPYTAQPGQSIGAALYAAGVRVFSRSFKYHRPRGLFCVAGDCPNCLMQVDGRPNVRTCIEPAHYNQDVRHQNAWPSLGFDVLRIFDKVDRLLPVGFYYKHFHKPRWLWPIFEHLVRRIAGVGRIDVNQVPEYRPSIEHLHTEVCVVGGGPAGLAAAAEAAAAGAEVLLLERQAKLGGHALYVGPDLAETDQFVYALQGNPRVRIFTNSTAFGLYEGNMLGAVQSGCFLKIRAKQIIVCSGGRERPLIFHNNDLPGIFLARGAQRLARLYGVRAGSKAVVLTNSDEGSRLAADLAGLGIEIAAVVDSRPAPGQRAGNVGPWPTWTSNVILAGQGNKHLQGVQVAKVDAEGRVSEVSVQQIDCDLLCVASALVPANELLLQGGMRYQFRDGRWHPHRKVPGLSVAGAAAGTLSAGAHMLEGRLRGAEAASALGYTAPALDEYRKAWIAWEQAPVPPPPGSSSLPRLNAGERKRFVCLCEDVTEKDLEQAVAEGFDGIETLKRYSTVNMGPCQGKVCSQAAMELCARATQRGPGDVGTTTSRPPVVPVELGVLAGGRHHPVRRTPLHHWHQAAGATWLDAGLWKRPERYEDPATEVHAVRTAVGLIDVSTLGKIEVIGPDAGELLERIYLNKWQDLKVGRARYGAMCTEEGILFDDGVGARLDSERFYLTATTGNAEAVVQWLELWRATWRLNAAILNRTSAMAAINLAGPRARDVLSRVTNLDVTTEAFPYMSLRVADVAAVPCRLLRIGFVGELGYEIHCPSAYAWHLWETLAEAGAEYGLKPFGVEAQRMLRLEKGHLIIGQDSDALSNPLEAGLEWLVRFEKPYFHGREILQRVKNMEPRSRLVGFTMVKRKLVPSEGCQVVEQGRPAGRVTSARYSSTLERSLGLAWVPEARSAVGERFQIRWNGSDVTAEVAPLPFYDPEGIRLRS